MTVPKTHRAAQVTEAGGRLVVQERPTPVPGPDQVLIRNHVIAVNPIDWKRVAFGIAMTSFPVVIGIDVAGTVAAAGSSVRNLKIGDRVVAPAVSMTTGNNDQGAYQEYTLAEGSFVTPLPDNIDLVDGATLESSVGTSAMALFDCLRVEIPKSVPTARPAISEASPVILVWGAASSVGAMAVQIARAVGFEVFATASSKNFDLVRRLGASVVVDYREASVAEDLVGAAKSAGKPVGLAIHAVGNPESQRALWKVLAASRGKRAAFTGLSAEVEPPTGMEALQIHGDQLFTRRSDLGAWFSKKFVPEALSNGVIRPSIPAQVVPGGLEGLQDALDMSRAGVSATKLVVKLV